MLPFGTEKVHSYLEARKGAKFPYTLFFGLYPYLNNLIDNFPTMKDLEEASLLSSFHFGSNQVFNRRDWEEILKLGYFPVKIKAVPEGSVIPIFNVLMTVVNTDKRFPWITNFLESYLTHVWYPTTVATYSRVTKELISRFLNETSNDFSSLPFMLHDFGYRGTTDPFAAAIGGAGHLINFLGTDTLPAMKLAHDFYNANYNGLAYSVPASEHSIMTSLGPVGESRIVDNLIQKNPTGILSVVADSYDIYNFVSKYLLERRGAINSRNGTFVVRPDSVTDRHPTPASLTLWIIEELGNIFGFECNSKGYKVLIPKVRVLWGDGIDLDGIEAILSTLKTNGWAANNMVFGMGGGLLQKHNRDTQRFAFKASANLRNGQWVDIYKKPIDMSKASKRGRLALSLEGNNYRTVESLNYEFKHDELVTVYEDGKLSNIPTFSEIRERAKL